VQEIAAGLEWDGDVVVADPDVLPPDLRVPLPAQDLFANTSRIRRELGYVESIPRRIALQRAVEWERAEQHGEPSPDYTSEDAALRSLRRERGL
jgi:nucleoside-diphosphate-sugar epimerase